MIFVRHGPIDRRESWRRNARISCCLDSEVYVVIVYRSANDTSRCSSSAVVKCDDGNRRWYRHSAMLYADIKSDVVVIVDVVRWCARARRNVTTWRDESHDLFSLTTMRRHSMRICLYANIRTRPFDKCLWFIQARNLYVRSSCLTDEHYQTGYLCNCKTSMLKY